MKIVFRLLWLAAAAAACVWLWTALFPGPEKIIRKRLASVAAEASFNGGENPILIAARAENLAGYFGTNVEISISLPEHDQHDFVGRAEITQAAAEMHSRMSSMKVELFDVNVAVGPDKQSATADLTVKFGTDRDKDFYVQEMKITFQKIEGDWLITRVETIRTLSRQGSAAQGAGALRRVRPAPGWRPALSA
jgi:hypothetical protein